MQKKQSAPHSPQFHDIDVYDGIEAGLSQVSLKE